MQTITFTISNADAQRLVDAFGRKYVENQEETKAQFARKELAKLVKTYVQNYELQEAQRQLSANSFDVTVT